MYLYTSAINSKTNYWKFYLIYFLSDIWHFGIDPSDVVQSLQKMSNFLE